MNDRMIIVIRFMWIPGIKPVIVPAMRPKRIARIISRNIVNE